MLRLEIKQKRLKAEVQYFRETCLLFDKSNVLFKIMDTHGTSRKTKSAEDLSNNLKLLFGKTSARNLIFFFVYARVLKGARTRL